MSIHSSHETELLEALAESTDAGECLLCAYDALEDMVDALLQNIFQKDDYSVKFVVDPLLTSDGPLGDIMIRAKLLLGLGVLDKETYDDIEIFVTLKAWVKVQEGVVDFCDENILFELNRVQAIKQTMPIIYSPEQVEGLSDELKEMFLIRHFQKVRSTIVLAVTSLIQSLGKENALTS
ncbi:transcriptional regulator [Vibrio astriarenae]|uniref:Transcriptional regulator n=1 Tax=Vibrio astriarenae TaxID=1481923 RepID=A0A7Z2YEN3_9VIBR|nr:MltR family transcriptional regulator [Vibrio astriarenae]QIA64279.1 transcriptional regulator [Vibrio astriarenae]